MRDDVFPFVIDEKRASWRQCMDFRKTCLRLWDVTEPKKIVTGLTIDSRPVPVDGKNRFYFTGKNELIWERSIIKRFDTEAISSEQNLFLFPVIDGKGIH